MGTQQTREHLIEAAESVIRRASRLEDISVRRIVTEAGTNVSAISYHFTSLEGLTVATASKVYRRLNLARLTELQAAVSAAQPRPVPIKRIIRALIGTSVRWSVNPESPYAIFRYLRHVTSMSDHTEILKEIVNDVDHHTTFVHYLSQSAPWFTESEIRWRLTAALGVRSQFTRQSHRAEVLTGESMTGDPEALIDSLCEIISAMFQRPVAEHAPTPQQNPRVSNNV
ncbi:TetR/AcrR family transcriptional regulator [Sulfitobacter geojensis]|uniref:TetR/AcrR family transcriptional regulator n=1 Tax=Sulfitobacter geojensis TaxID=1342299 RepID=UPI00046A311C|nr:TetR/AcrR family transcriptional regulator [Sulfitobacter geojensis]NYI30239.1 AcrR family transcriptional regulator [Sulfitobacter geojensis]